MNNMDDKSDNKNNNNDNNNDNTSINLLETLLKVQEDGDERNISRSIFSNYFGLHARQEGCPTSGIFELTPQCNLDCKMCYVHLKKNEMHGISELSGDKWIKLIDDAIKEGMMYAQLTGGEALLHPDFDDIFMHLYNNGIRTSLVTNGLLLNERRIEFFKKYTPAKMQITLYGSDNDKYEEVTGHRVFDTIENNIKMAKDIGCNLNLACTPSIYFTPDDVRKAFELADELGIKLNVNSDLSTPRMETGRADNPMDISLDDYFIIRRTILEHADAKIEKPDTKAPIPAGLIEHDNSTENGEADISRGLKCGSGRSLFCINWKGQMMSCLDLDFSEDPFKIGFKEAWQSINRQSENYIVPSECSSCDYKSVCNPCPALHLKGAPKGHADKRICARIQRMYSEGLVRLHNDK